MSKIHILSDEKLDGILREYIEVDRKAKGGEKIVMKYPLRGSLYKEGDIFTVLESYEIYPAYNDGVEVKENDGYFIYHSEYYTLEPTDIIHIDNKRYRLVNRKAKAGEKVIITETHPTLVYTKIGEIVKIIETDGDTCGGMLKPHDIGEKGAVYHFQYQVLESVESVNDIITAEENDSKSVINLLTNLTQRLVELEKRVVAIDEYNDVLIDRINDVEGKLNQIKTPYFTTFKPNIYFNIHTKEKSVEELAKEIIKELSKMNGKYNE